ncbi:MAG: hypothetical protein P8L85_24935 [Rubripirellula sp.]|nr:hypothetical protein [Rubripirellula sp.]
MKEEKGFGRGVTVPHFTVPHFNVPHFNVPGVTSLPTKSRSQEVLSVLGGKT